MLITIFQAPNTLGSYAGIIKKWKTFCEGKGFVACPADVKHLSEFIAQLSLDNAPLSTFSKLAPALVFYHQANRIQEPLAINDSFVKLLVEGAKREAAKRKPPTKKAPSLTQQEIHSIIDQTLWKDGPGVIGASPDLLTWRTVVRLYTCYKCFCRWSCYQQLTPNDVTFHADHVSIEFRYAKNDQFYSGSFSFLSVIPGSPYCPGLIFSSYITVMKFSRDLSVEFLNCRVLRSKEIYRAKPSEKLSYSNSSKDTKTLLASLGLHGNYSEKSFKVSGVSRAIDNNVPLIDVQAHGRWKSLETPLIYTQKSLKRKLGVSNVVT